MLATLLISAFGTFLHSQPLRATDAAMHSEGAGGYAVAIGGALRYDHDAVWSRLVELAGGKGSRFVVLATAADDPERSAARAIATLRRYGAVAEHVAVAPRIPGIDLERELADPKWIDKVRGATGIYFTGGAQERIVDTLQPGGRPSPLLEAIWDVYRRGGVIAGTSAGAAIMSRTMFRDAEDVMAVLKGSLRDGREVDRGLGFVGPDLFVDQHFLRRGRLGRMLPLMQSRGFRTGLGVEEDSAAIIRGNEVEVIGAGGALFVDLSGSSADASLGAFNIHGARLTYLGDGDRLNLGTRTLTPSPHKVQGQCIDPRSPDFSPTFTDVPFFMDILGDGTIVSAMSVLLDSPLDEVRGLAFDARPGPGRPQRALGFEFRFRKGPDTIGWFTSSLGPEVYSIANVYLDVVPVRVADPVFGPWQP